MSDLNVGAIVVLGTRMTALQQQQNLCCRWPILDRSKMEKPPEDDYDNFDHSHRKRKRKKDVSSESVSDSDDGDDGYDYDFEEYLNQKKKD